MKKISGVSLLIQLSFFILVYSQIPPQMSYQGYLTDNANNPINGNHKLTFTIYDAQSAGNTLWMEEHPVVAINQGVFRVQLGSITPLNLPFDAPYWMSIKVENDPELTPRVTLSSVAYSFNSIRAEGVAEGSISTAGIQDGAVTLPKLGPDLMLKVFEGTCNNVNSYLITGLDGNLHKMYRIFFQGIIHTGETWLLLQPNEDNVLNNYRSYVTFNGDASGGQWSGTGHILARSWVEATDTGFEATLFAETGRPRFAIAHSLTKRISSGYMLGQETYGFWYNNADNITSIKVSLTNFSGIATGTFSGTVTIYAVNPR